MARMALLLAGLPVEVGGQTVNRLCGSGLQAINSAAHAIEAGDGDVFVAGGVESMTRAPFVMAKPGSAWDRGPRELQDTTLGWRFVNPKLAEHYYPYSMGETAENVAERCGVVARGAGRVRAESQQRGRSRRSRTAASTARSCRSRCRSGRATRSSSTRDEHPRADTTLEALAKLRPAFRGRRIGHGRQRIGHQRRRVGGRCSSRRNAPRELGLQPLARVVSTAVAGVDPAVMGIGPIPASRKALARAGIGVDDLDLVELNEAFAAQSLVCIDELGLDPEKVNVNGGAIALGHPLGMSGGAARHDARPRAAPDAAGATAWRRCASASARASRRSSSGSTGRGQRAHDRSENDQPDADGDQHERLGHEVGAQGVVGRADESLG